MPSCCRSCCCCSPPLPVWRTPRAGLDTRSTDVPSRAPHWPNATPRSALLLERPPGVVRLGMRGQQDALFRPPATQPPAVRLTALSGRRGTPVSAFFLPLNTKLVRHRHQVNYGDPGAPNWPLGRADRGLAVLWAAAACLPTRVLTRARCGCSKCSCVDLEHTPESQWSLLGRQVTWGPLRIATRAR